MRKKSEKIIRVDLKELISNSIESRIRRSIDTAEEKVKKNQLYSKNRIGYNFL